MLTATEAKERPAIFTAESVRGIIAGTKTQTRRALKPQPGSVTGELTTGGIWLVDTKHYVACPYGRPGDRLWVKEGWAQTTQAISDEPGIVYRATDPDWETMEGWRWSSPLYMRRVASRITLEITQVRVERIQGISDSDVFAEGLRGGHVIPPEYPNNLQGAFAKHWDDINGKRAPWASSPWVWAITFKRL